VLLATNSRDRGATSRTLEAWARWLPAHGVRPLVSIGGGGPLFEALRAQGTETFVQPIRVWPSVKTSLPFARTVARLAWIIRRHGVDLVHVNEHDHHRAPALAARLAGVPVVTHLRFRPESSYARWLFKGRYVPSRLFFTSQTQLADTSEALRGAVPPGRWRVVYNGLTIAEFAGYRDERPRLRREWGLDDATVALGVACAISKRKQVDHFIRLVARLRAGGLKVHGFVAGHAHFPEDEALVGELRELTSALGLKDHLRFLGYVEPSAPLFHAWDISVSTSAYETFGMAVLEAMACGCATVAYAGGSVAEVGAGTIPIVADGDEAGLFEACARLCRNPGERAAVGAAAQDRAKAFDVAIAVLSLVQEYRAVLAETETRRGAGRRRRYAP
jgi:glycosyltransferase involved in cell wall biosynthesis